MNGVLEAVGAGLGMALYAIAFVALCHIIRSGIQAIRDKRRREKERRLDPDASEEILLRVPPGRREELLDHARRRGESLNSFINRAIDDRLEGDR